MISEAENTGDKGKITPTRKRRRWLDYTWRTLLFGMSLLALLMLFTGLRIEWRGGYVPALTWHKTKASTIALPNTAPFPRNKLTSSPASNTSSDWPGFRGPGRDGIVRQSIPTNWPTGGLPLLWRISCGSGYGSFAIAEGMAFTLEQRESNEVLIAYSLENGSVIWSQHWPALFQEYFAGEGPRSTPSYSDGKVYTLGALGRLGCYQAADGSPVWSRDLLEGNRTNAPAYGVASSPLIFGTNLVVLAAGGKGESILCLDKNSGQKTWAVLDDPPGYASPILIELAGVKQIIVSLAKRTIGLDPQSGKLLWEYPWRVGSDQMPIAQPVIISSNRFLLSGGYFTGCALVEVTSTSNGIAAKTIWRNKDLKNKFTSSVFYQGYIYGLDEDILTCLDAVTGERKWKDGRYGYGQVLLAQNHLIILSGSGELALVEASPTGHLENARFQAITGKTWNHPAVAQDRILIRNGAEIACYHLGSREK